MIEQDIPNGGQVDASPKPYPYVGAKTYEFLKSVVRDGTQRTIPKRTNLDGWVRARNITGIYFSCNITLEELGAIYGITQQRVDKIIDQTLRHFWENSIGYDQLIFPLDSLSTKNGATKHRINRFSKADQIRFYSMIKSGATDDDVGKKFGVSLDMVRAAMREMERVEQITTLAARNKRAIEQLETLPFENYEERQNAIGTFGPGFYHRNRFLFANLSEVARLLGIKIPRSRYTRMDDFADELKNKGIPVGLCIQNPESDGVLKRDLFVWRKDYERLQRSLEQATNPSEIQSPTF